MICEPFRDTPNWCFATHPTCQSCVLWLSNDVSALINQVKHVSHLLYKRHFYWMKSNDDLWVFRHWKQCQVVPCESNWKCEYVPVCCFNTTQWWVKERIKQRGWQPIKDMKHMTAPVNDMWFCSFCATRRMKKQTPIGQPAWLHITQRAFHSVTDRITAPGKYALYRLLKSLISLSAPFGLT